MPYYALPKRVLENGISYSPNYSIHPMFFSNTHLHTHLVYIMSLAILCIKIGLLLICTANPSFFRGLTPCYFSHSSPNDIL